jgi:hypothetical protein
LANELYGDVDVRNRAMDNMHSRLVGSAAARQEGWKRYFSRIPVLAAGVFVAPVCCKKRCNLPVLQQPHEGERQRVPVPRRIFLEDKTRGSVNT